MTGRRVIVAGVDGSRAGFRAVEYAAELAAAQGRRLRLLHACDPLTADNPTTPGVDSHDVRAYGTAALEHAERRATEAAAGVVVEQLLVHGPPARALRHASISAATLVIGRDDEMSSRPPQLSTGAVVVASASAPVVSVPGSWMPGHGDHRVVVGADGTDQSHDALAYAFAEASRRRASLMAVRIWDSPDTDADADARPDPDALMDWYESARLALAEDLAGWAESHPDVQVTRVVEFAPSAAHALVGRSEGAALLVIGARSFGAAHVVLPGPTAREVFAHATVPVAFVHAGDMRSHSAELDAMTARRGG